MLVKIQQIYDDINQIFGAGKLYAIMKEEGYHISVEMVHSLMRDMGLYSIRNGAKSFYEKEKRRYSNRLKQNFTATEPNQFWVGDVTCFRFKDVNYYICVILDLYDRAVVGCKISFNNSTHLTKSIFSLTSDNLFCKLCRIVFSHTFQNRFKNDTFCALGNYFGCR